MGIKIKHKYSVIIIASMLITTSFTGQCGWGNVAGKSLGFAHKFFKSSPKKYLPRKREKYLINPKNINDKITVRKGNNRYKDSNGRTVINSHYAGKSIPIKKFDPSLGEKYKYPIKFNQFGYPDFTPYVRQTIKSTKLTGAHSSDYIIADRAMRKKIPGWRRPPNMTWHHHQDKKTMQLIPTDIHNAVRHSGGASRLRLQ